MPENSVTALKRRQCYLRITFSWLISRKVSHAFARTQCLFRMRVDVEPVARQPTASIMLSCPTRLLLRAHESWNPTCGFASGSPRLIWHHQ